MLYEIKNAFGIWLTIVQTYFFFLAFYSFNRISFQVSNSMYFRSRAPSKDFFARLIMWWTLKQEQFLIVVFAPEPIQKKMFTLE